MVSLHLKKLYHPPLLKVSQQTQDIRPTFDGGCILFLDAISGLMNRLFLLPI